MRSFPEVFCNCLILIFALYFHNPSTVDELSGATLRHVSVDGVSVDGSLYAIVHGWIQRCRVIAQWHCKLSSASPDSRLAGQCGAQCGTLLGGIGGHQHW